MWRTRAVVSLLVEDIAGLELSPDEVELPELAALDRAIRRARLVIGVDCLAVLALFLTRDASRPFLPWEPAIGTVFTFGILAVAVHAGFRWAQLDRYHAVKRLCRELLDRVDE